MKNITWERLVKDGAVTYPCDGKDKPGNEVILEKVFNRQQKGKLACKTCFSDGDEKFPLVLQLEDSLSIGTPVQ